MNIQNLLSTNIRINNVDPLDPLSIWPQGIEISIFRIPIRKRDGYSLENTKKLAKKLKSNMVKNGIVFIICYAPNEDKARPFEVAKTFTDEGFTHIDTIALIRSWLPGKRSESNLVNAHEHILHFCNGKIWSLDRLPIQEYLKTEEGVCPGNVWKIDTGSLEESYPLDLAELLIRMSDVLPGSVIFDAYMGTSSTLAACLKLGHTFHGMEKNQTKINRYKKIIDEHSKKEE